MSLLIIQTFSIKLSLDQRISMILHIKMLGKRGEFVKGLIIVETIDRLGSSR